MQLNNLTFNLSNALTRNATLHGRPYIVAPMVMLTEGVHVGSGGPLYYPAAECKRAVPAWNMKPVVVYHPEINGVGVSACDPDILEAQQVGVVMNTQWRGKLRAEAWIEEGLASKVDSRVLDALVGNKVMELSTGLFTENDPTPGTWGKEQYTAIARNHQPDHLALLPDKVGACSIADGAGLLQLNETANAYGVPSSVLLAAGRRLLGNALSHAGTYAALSSKLAGRLGLAEDAELWLVDVYDDFFIYEYEGKLCRLPYTKGGDSVAIPADAEPETVKRVTEYRTETGEYVGNGARVPNANQGEPKMAKKEVIDGLIANKATQWAEGDRAVLEAMDEGTLAKLAPVANSGSTPPGDPDLQANKGKGKYKGKGKGKAGGDDDDDDDEMVDNQAGPQAVTLEQLPPEVRAVYNHGLAALNAEKSAAIKTITGNAQNKFTEEYLQTLDLPQLQGMAALCQPPAQPQAAQGAVPMFSGAATPPTTPGPTGNAADDNLDGDIYVAPGLSWDEA